MNNIILACPACMEAFKSAGGNAAGASILLLLIVVLALLSTISFFFVRLIRRESGNLDPDLMD